MEIIIPGNPITKKNSQRIVTTRSGRPFVLPSQAFKDYEETVRCYIRWTDAPIDYPVNIKCLYYMKTHRRVDLVNLLEATDDILVSCGVLKDDNAQIIVSHDGSRVYYDKEEPRAEIIIEPSRNHYI